MEARAALRVDAPTLRGDAPLIPLVGLLRRDELCQIHAFQARKLPSSFDGFFRFGLGARDDAAGLRALFAQDARQLARVDLRDRNGLAAAQELLETALGAPVTDDRREVANDETGRVSLRGFEVVGILAEGADVRIRQRDDLTVVRRVRQDLLIARHGGVENELP